jgi:parallel beta-helix repeat protein
LVGGLGVHFSGLKKLLSCFFICAFLLAAIDLSSVAGFPPNGDWVVTGTEVCSGQIVVLNGNLTVESSGNLTLVNVVLRLNCNYNGQFNINVKPGGKLYVLSRSVISSVDPDKRFSFFVWNEATFRMNESELHNCGWGSSDWTTSGLQIRSDDAIIENSLISNNNIGICDDSSGMIIRNNNISANDVTGIHGGSRNTTIYNNYISRSGEGIACGGNLNIRNNTIELNDAKGIAIRNSSPTVANNTIMSNGDGIWLEQAIDPVILDNTLMFNRYAGIGGTNSLGVFIEGNNITLNQGWAGIVLKGGVQATIQGNVIMNNSGDGIHFGSDVDLLVQGNIIASNNGNGLVSTLGAGGNATAEIHWNDIYANDEFEAFTNNEPSVIFNATHNYWGGVPKPEEISANVPYNPWLTDSIAPSVEIKVPASGETVASMVAVQAEPDAPNGIQSVGFSVDGQLEQVDYEQPFEWNWDTTMYTETGHVITAKLRDKFGLEASALQMVFVDNTSPTVSIEEPASNNTCHGLIGVAVKAADNREVGNVHVKLDNSQWSVTAYDSSTLLWKYELNTTSFSDGKHTIMALALDKAGNPATTSVEIFTDNTGPKLNIRSPQSGTTVGLTLTVDVEASDSTGISKIEFYIQDVLVCTLSVSPFQWSWDTTKYPNGEYTVNVKAYDIAGNVKSGEIRVNVKNVELPWWQEHFWTIVQVLIAVGGLTIAILTFATKRKHDQKDKD